MQPAEIEAVLSPTGWKLLEALPPYDESTSLSLGERMRAKGVPAEIVAACLTQSRLRVKARAKFGEFADGMIFTPDGLEQATRLTVAAHHARRFQDAGVASLADLGCGIGGDAMACAALGIAVLAVDKDPMTAAVATVNLRHFDDARVVCAAAEETGLEGRDAVFLDPARRAGGRRIFDPEACSPPLSFVESLARGEGQGQHLRAAANGDRAVGAKVAPGIPHAAIPAGAEAQWVSVGGDVVEAGLWFGPLARGEHRSALVLSGAGAHALSSVDLPQAEVGAVGDYLFEPDGAVIRAGLVGHVAAALAGGLVDETIAYVTTSDAGLAEAGTPFATGYGVRDVLPFGLKSLKAYLREHKIGKVVIKKRGTAVEPDQLRRQLKPSQFGPGSATLILTRVAGRQSVIVADPLVVA
ncbi:SAM-dependent methyltransferase [Micrococcales bacterium 31B]|nr:SAM-dependent methyltransferase [Micrococcales bacterium 31B]